LKRFSPNWLLLGVVRFFLAFVVLSEHLGWFFESGLLLKATEFSALVAVLAFLLISGFSIAASYEARKEGFYLRRTLRIMPIYVASIIVSLLVFYYFSHADLLSGKEIILPELFDIVGNIFLMQGVFVHSIESNPIVWTLMIECFFYVITPWLNSKNRLFVWAILISALLFASQRYSGFYYFSQMLYGLNVLYLGWAWLAGFWFYHHRNREGASFFILCLGTVVIAVNGYFTAGFWVLTWGVTCTVIGYGHLVRLPCPRAVKLLGDISYPLYLFHIPVLYFLSLSGLSESIVISFFMVIFVSIAVDFLDRYLKVSLKKF